MTTTLQALSVPCPACQAKVGDHCTQPTDTGRREVLWVHMARDDAYHWPTEEEK